MHSAMKLVDLWEIGMRIQTKHGGGLPKETTELDEAPLNLARSLYG